MIPADLADMLAKNDEEDLSIAILNANFENKEASFKILVSGYSYDEEAHFQYEWTIETVNYRTSKIMFDKQFYMEIVTEHPILWEFSDKQSELYFRGATDFTQNLYHELYQVHYSCFENLIDFQQSIYCPHNFERLRKPASGLFAKGSNQLMQRYGKILEGYGIHYSIVGERIPNFWNGNSLIEEGGLAKVLFIDSSYIIADDFLFKNKTKR